jgi:hypothetical protein
MLTNAPEKLTWVFRASLRNRLNSQERYQQSEGVVKKKENMTEGQTTDDVTWGQRGNMKVGRGERRKAKTRVQRVG